ncbi:DUF5134 domain-containing protein [Haloechinothrix sp. LS1_15]|uniref:DUF5134 domain-containing protein n=1 Tax=Haloechinothrix sp. LS1_15 TaxID=2652248 RepID=UPI002945EA99|nr:DUF5134 domain-containing protein [Haloechinothrix sp. LS1_15]MDV6014186.1 DUF5134 domain-containing protein [Haloechinothrix sp. LS1_15]
MDAPEPVLWGLSVLFLAIAAASLARLVIAHPHSPLWGRVRREDEVAELLMALGMLAMVSPVGGPIPQAGWEAAFVVAALWLGVLWLREVRASCGSGCARSRCGHHAIGAAVMVYMFAGMVGHGDHAAHEAGPWLTMAGHEGTLVLAPLAFAAAGYFFVDTAMCVVRCVRGPRAEIPEPVPVVLRLGTRELGRGAMSVGMAGMLLAMV